MDETGNQTADRPVRSGLPSAPLSGDSRRGSVSGTGHQIYLPLPVPHSGNAPHGVHDQQLRQAGAAVQPGEEAVQPGSGGVSFLHRRGEERPVPGRAGLLSAASGTHLSAGKSL